MPQTTLRPVKPVTETVADIMIMGNHVQVSFFERDDDFREVVKDHGFRWSWDAGCWERKCNQFTGSPLDRATEICISLLKAGFIISIVDDTLKEKILKKEFEPEQKRWIKAIVDGKHKGWFSLSWEYGNERIYKAARAVAGSRWSRPNVIIPPYQFEAILDMKDLYGFELSIGALKIVAEAGVAKEEALIVDMSETVESPIKEKPKTEEAGIHASLLDTD
jgi:hypothetical protein